MKSFSNGFYIIVAIVTVLWSLFSSGEQNEEKKTSFLKSDQNTTEIVSVNLSQTMLSASESKKRLRALDKYIIQTDSKIRNRGGTGTAFYVGNNLWVTARHVINQCPKVYMAEFNQSVLIKKIFLHPNSDLAVFRHEGNVQTPYFKRNGGDNRNTFSSGFPAGNPGDIAISFSGYAAIENREYNVFEKGLVFTITDRDPYHLDSIGGLSGGPTFTKTNELRGVLVAENVRRSLAIVVDMSAVNSLLLEIDPQSNRNSRNQALSYKINNNNFATIGQKIRNHGSIRKIFCVI